MRGLRFSVGALVLAGLLVGCGESGPAEATKEEKSPDFGQMSGDKMKSMIGTPGGTKDVLKKQDAANKEAGAAPAK
jgi:hypothetical protein